MFQTVVVSCKFSSTPTPAHCYHCGRTDAFIPGETELLTPRGWQPVCMQCEAALDLPGLKLCSSLSYLYSLPNWLVLN